MRTFKLILIGIILLAANSKAEMAQSGAAQSGAANETKTLKARDWQFVTLGLTPVQSGGRVKPLDSLAREWVLFETGSRKFEGWNPTDLVLSWIVDPNYWDQYPLIRVSREDVRRQLGIDEKRSLFSPKELFHNTALMQYAEEIQRGGASAGAEPPSTSKASPKTNPREQELKAVLDRIGLFHSVISGQGWPVIPKSAPQAWGTLAGSEKEGELIRGHFVQVIKSYEAGDQSAFERAALLFKAAVEGEIPGYAKSLEYQVIAESVYNRYRPFLIAWILFLCGSVLWVAGMGLKKSRINSFAFFFTGLGTVNLLAGIALRCFVAGRPPVTNMYESVIWVSFGAVLFGFVLYILNRQAIILAVSSVLATLGLIAADSAPAMLDASINPLVPVLRSNYWLTIHVLTITLGYAAFALTLGLANISLFHYLKKGSQQKIALLNQLTYRAMQFGVVLIAAGTILGGIWADYSWGRFWGWDPKEVWALITLLCYIVVLHGRYTNWVGQFAFAALSAICFMSVVMAWYGVNFILGVGLHSYGFSSGGTPWVFAFAAAQLAYVGLAALRHRGSKRLARA